jgi:DNA-binding NarL/FixJ family response regulator
MSNALKIGLIDGDRGRIEAVVKRCCLDGGLEVAWATDRWDRYAELQSKAQPAALVIDVDLDVGDAFGTALPVPGRPPARSILITSELPSPGLDRFRGLRPYAVLLKQDPLSTLLLYLKQIQAESMRAAAPEPAPDDGRRFRFDSPLNVLTARQVQILKCLARGDSVKEAATCLSLTAKSVTNHKYRIMQKLGVDDRVKLARLAIREGLIEP